MAADDLYGSVAGYQAWASARGYDALADPELTQYLILATQYIEERYRGRWKGVRAESTQTLAWPRIRYQDSSLGVCDEDGYEVDPLTVPERVEFATYEAGKLVSESIDLQPDLAFGGKIKRLKQRVEGAVEQETEYFSSASARTTRTAIDGLLKGLVTSASIHKVLRA